MVGNLEDCWLITYQSPEKVIQDLLPKPFEAVTKDGYAFWNVVICRLTGMRPRWFPLGIDYWHVAYRTLAKFTTKEGEVIEGLYFFRSDSQPGWLAPLGNLMTEFNFHPAKIQVEKNVKEVRFEVLANGGNAQGQFLRDQIPQLPATAPFQSLEEAKHFLQYKPCGFFSQEEGKKVNAVFIKRDEKVWQYQPMRASGIEFEFLKPYPAEFLMAFEVNPIRYQWNRGEIIET